MNLRLLLLYLCVICANVLCNTHYSSSDERKKYCGNTLTNALALACRGLYNGLITKRDRDRLDNVIEDKDDLQENGPFPPSFPWRLREAAFRMLPFGLRKRNRLGEKRGVADECCHKACTFGEMLSYCQN